MTRQAVRRTGHALRHSAVLALLLLAVACGGTGLNPGDHVTSKHVSSRLALMAGQKAEIEALIAMTSGRTAFDRARAKAARGHLIRSTGTIRKRFRKPRLDRRSHARVLIWQSWDDFKDRAAAAEAAAKALNTRNLKGLRRTLPGLMQRCQSCHETYRDTPNTFITH
ncbi:cytochrome c [Cribrihabitans neustonicus]|uniref:cytochrome c n=1 Tax=Cribrihabitans neustonicus TaxID=1429085 RepID=UPI003B5A7976